METVQREEQLAEGGAALASASLLLQGGWEWWWGDWLLLRRRLAAWTGPDRRHGNGYKPIGYNLRRAAEADHDSV